LALQLYAPWQGDILLQGKCIKSYAKQEIANLIGFVDQECILFEGTLKDNLTLWNDHIPMGRIHDAIKDAEIISVIEAKEKRLDTEVLEFGKNLSVGERQRLEFARALIQNPRLLILDEATANLDALTEAKIFEHLKKRRISLLVIAHRLRTIQNADEIIVIENGKVASRGNHESLKMEGLYEQYVAGGRL